VYRNDTARVNETVSKEDTAEGKAKGGLHGRKIFKDRF